MGIAAAALLDSLDDDQRAVVAWPFDDQAERERWYYTPTDHGGLPLSSMRPRQQQRTLQLVAEGLSTPGYVTASAIIGLDNVLDHVEGWVRDWGRERGRDPGLFYVRVFGDPSGDAPWSWRFGGHHISISHVVVDGEVVGSSPLFLGADPASMPLLGPHPSRPLAGVEDVARELVRSLDDVQRAAALVSSVAPVDLVSANRPRYGQGAGDLPLDLAYVWRDEFTGELATVVVDMQRSMDAAAGITPGGLEPVRLTMTARGLSAAHLRADQRDTLRALLDLYVRRLPDSLAGEEGEKFASDGALDSLSFLWAGGLEPGEAHYYRVQGPTLLAEYDNTQRGANHVHTVWRDPGRDFGADPLVAHYAKSHG